MANSLSQLHSFFDCKMKYGLNLLKPVNSTGRVNIQCFFLMDCLRNDCINDKCIMKFASRDAGDTLIAMVKKVETESASQIKV